MPLAGMREDESTVGMHMPNLQMPNLLQTQHHPSIVPMNYEVGMGEAHVHMSPTLTHVRGAENMIDSMEPALKFEEDEDAFKCTSPDDFFGFFRNVSGGRPPAHRVGFWFVVEG